MKKILFLLVAILCLSSCKHYTKIKNPDSYTRYTHVDKPISNLFLAIDDDGELHYNYYDSRGKFVSRSDMNAGLWIDIKRENIPNPVYREHFVTYVHSEAFSNDTILTQSYDTDLIVLPLDFVTEFIDD